MKIGTITFCLFLVFFSCKDVQDKATESVTNTVIEKTLENAGVATENIARANKNATQVSISLEDKKLFDKDVFNGIVNATERMIVFSLDSENDDAKINISFSGLKNMLEVKPISGKNEEGKLDPKDANGTVVSITMAKENEYAYTLLEGEATISKLNQDEVIIDFSGKAGSFPDANKPENWKPIQGKIVSKYPVMNFIQIKKEDLFY